MTYATRCEHGELWAVCRECPDDVSPWVRADPFRAPLTDEEPWSPSPERDARDRSRLLAAGCVLALALLTAYLWSIR